jgi:hypothetical protein
MRRIDDRLSLTLATERAGIDRSVAEQIVVAINELLDHVARKPEIALLRT